MSFNGTDPSSPVSAGERIDHIVRSMSMPVFKWDRQERVDGKNEAWVYESVRVDHDAAPALPNWMKQAMTTAARRAIEVTDIGATVRHLDWEAARNGSQALATQAPLAELEAFWREGRPEGMTDEMVDARLRGAIAVRFLGQGLADQPEATSLDRSTLRVGEIVTQVLVQNDLLSVQAAAPSAAA